MVARTTIRVASTWSTTPAAAWPTMADAGIAGATRLFHPGADQRRLGLQKRHRLTLHVRAHQRPVGVVVLEERNQRRGHRNQLLGRDVHQLDNRGAQP